ncbi:MAG: (E)-4-hydroxy-3-methylbut-2-enyl-diphosphate synthase [Verrucomicrobiota bacterium]
MKSFCKNPFIYSRRKTRQVMVGTVGIGGDNPIRVQSMITCDTMDTDACVKQTMELVEAGCEIIRITAPTVKDAANLKNIKAELMRQNCLAPLVADILFKPAAAMEAAQWVEKVRINPGNFADKKKFAIKEYTDEEYLEELDRIEEEFLPLLYLLKERKLALRIGTNHGSLSDRIMNRYGDTPQGMVESALEFARICRKFNFHNFLFSMKSSNPKVMINAYRLLVSKLEEEGEDCNYPIHLGVTEAGDGEDGRIKSAIGIGSLLSDGVGDTIRVSLTEDCINEIPVARKIVAQAQKEEDYPPCPHDVALSFDPFQFAKRNSYKTEINGIPLGGSETTRVFATRHVYTSLEGRLEEMGDTAPEIVYEDSGVIEVDLGNAEQIKQINALDDPVTVTVKDGIALNPIMAFRVLASKIHPMHPILLKDTLNPEEEEDILSNMLHSSNYLGSLLCDGIGDAILIRREKAPGAAIRLGFNILQASGNRIFKTDYVACPSCGRTLFDLQTTTAKIKEATGHLKGVRIAVMGCIVNGPGEMADADFGYVGGGPKKINLYVGKTPVKFNIPEVEAVDRLKDLIKEHNKWVDPPLKKEEATLGV